MTQNPQPSLDQVMALAHYLPARDQARLVAQLVARLADAQPATTIISDDAWDAWAALRTEISQHLPPVHLLERLEANRNEHNPGLSNAGGK